MTLHSNSFLFIIAVDCSHCSQLIGYLEYSKWPAPRCIHVILLAFIDPFNNDVVRWKALKSVSFVLNEFSQTANIECTLTTYGTKEVNNLEMKSVSTISHEERLLLQHFSVNDVILKRIYITGFFFSCKIFAWKWVLYFIKFEWKGKDRK